MLKRAGFYVDGFNLYHALDALDEPFLKWLSLKRLGNIIIPSRTEELVRVVYCSAYFPSQGDNQQKRWRHEQYVNALTAEGVECVMGHFVHEDWSCRDCGHAWRKPTEKESDINLALHLFEDARRNVFDHAYLLTSDSDHAATARMLRAAFPEKRLTTVAPPGRKFSEHIRQLSAGSVSLNKTHLERALLPPRIISHDGRHAKRPDQYAPPQWWVDPQQRPKD